MLHRPVEPAHVFGKFEGCAAQGSISPGSWRQFTQIDNCDSLMAEIKFPVPSGLIQKKEREITWIQGHRRVMQGHFPQNPLKIPVLMLDSRESGRDSGLLRTAPTVILLESITYDTG